MTEEACRAAQAGLKIARQGDAGEMQAMILAYILIGGEEHSVENPDDRRAAYERAVDLTVAFTRLSEPTIAAGYAAAARWMLAHSWHKA